MDTELFQKKIDAYVVFNPSNRFYFTRLNTSMGCVVLTEKEKVFFTDFRYALAARATLTDFTIETVTNDTFYSSIAKTLKRLGAKTVGYEDDFLTVVQFKNVKAALAEFLLKPAGDILLSARLIKTDEEIAAIAFAQKIAEKSLQRVISFLKVGVTEREISAELTFEMIKNGADGTSFPNIVAFGENSAKPHHEPSDKKLEKSDLIMMDFGAKAGGYCSDMTRTFCLGTPHDELLDVYKIVLEAQNYALQRIHAGMTGKEADSFAREFITANGYGSAFGHSLGHGVGIDIHEAPTLGMRSETILRPNMIVTVEPGIYVDGLGGVRIEDMVVVKDNGIINLTNFNKNLNI